MDQQVSLPFIIFQELTFTTEDDAYDAIKSCAAGSGDKRKRQFSMQVFAMLGRGKERTIYLKGDRMLGLTLRYMRRWSGNLLNTGRRYMTMIGYCYSVTNSRPMLKTL
jgi:hypothetical protein